MPTTTHRLVVELLDHHVVDEQRRQIQALQDELAALKANYNRLEFTYGCTVSMLTQVTDYCREHRYDLPKRLWENPRDLFPVSGLAPDAQEQKKTRSVQKNGSKG